MKVFIGVIVAATLLGLAVWIGTSLRPPEDMSAVKLSQLSVVKLMCLKGELERSRPAPGQPPTARPTTTDGVIFVRNEILDSCGIATAS